MAPTGEQEKPVATAATSAGFVDRIDERRRWLGFLFVAAGGALMAAGSWFAIAG